MRVHINIVNYKTTLSQHESGYCPTQWYCGTESVALIPLADCEKCAARVITAKLISDNNLESEKYPEEILGYKILYTCHEQGFCPRVNIDKAINKLGELYTDKEVIAKGFAEKNLRSLGDMRYDINLFSKDPARADMDGRESVDEFVEKRDRLLNTKDIFNMDTDTDNKILAQMEKLKIKGEELIKAYRDNISAGMAGCYGGS